MPGAAMEDDDQEMTEALASLRLGASDAMDALLPRVYGDLRRIAHRQLGNERAGHTLSTTAVVRSTTHSRDSR